LTLLLSFLWTPSRRRVSLTLVGHANAAARRIEAALASSEEVTGRVVGRGVKIERHPRFARQRGAFIPVYYGLIKDDGEGCRLAGHFQLHPVGRLYIAAWIGLSTLLALALLVAGALRATPESTAQDALPFMLPVLLPFLGLGLARWQRRRGQADEAAIRDWLISLRMVGLDASDERG
jgi:hypothetical protein